MKKNVYIHYDEKGDILEVRFGKPALSYLEGKGDDVFERRDEKTGKCTGITILNFKKRKERRGSPTTHRSRSNILIEPIGIR
mgnify:FL=1